MQLQDLIKPEYRDAFMLGFDHGQRMAAVDPIQVPPYDFSIGASLFDTATDPDFGGAAEPAPAESPAKEPEPTTHVWLYGGGDVVSERVVQRLEQFGRKVYVMRKDGGYADQWWGLSVVRSGVPEVFLEAPVVFHDDGSKITAITTSGGEAVAHVF